MLSMLIDDGLLVRENGHWTAVGDIGAVRVPPTSHALLAARLDRLGPDERTVIERAAVAGNVFYEGAIAELAPEVLRPAVVDSLGALVRKELIRPERASLGQLHEDHRPRLPLRPRRDGAPGRGDPRLDGSERARPRLPARRVEL